jgi:hypothetical protein
MALCRFDSAALNKLGILTIGDMFEVNPAYHTTIVTWVQFVGSASHFSCDSSPRRDEEAGISYIRAAFFFPLPEPQPHDN